MIDANEFITTYCLRTGQSIYEDVEQDVGLPSESFRIDKNKLRFSDFAGLRNGLNVINRYSREKRSRPEGPVSPSFKRRGVIEGFYGKPWTHQQRKRAMTLFAEYNMNTFTLAPKDDPWQRFDWRTPFASEFLEKTSELVALGKELLIEVSVCVSPGLTITYSSEEDREALLVRYRQLMGIGVERFGLLLDDISGDLQFADDKARYQNISEAHADLANTLNASLKVDRSDLTLFVCPLQYHGRGNEPYIANLGKSLGKDIDLMWTGRQICSEYLDEIDAERFFKETTKQPLYWDNYPVNDVAMIHQLHVGPLEKREPNLGAYSEGLVANPMDLFEASLLPLLTVADYLWDSRNYNPENSWDLALVRLFEVEEERSALRHLFQNCFESCLAVDSAPEFGKLLGNATLAWRTGNIALAVKKLYEHGELIVKNYNLMNNESFSLPSLRREIEPWLRKYHQVGRALFDVSKILQRATFSDGRILGLPGMAEEVKAIRISLAQNPTRIFGDGLDLVLGELATELSVV